jgi:hypothetical protein
VKVIKHDHQGAVPRKTLDGRCDVLEEPVPFGRRCRYGRFQPGARRRRQPSQQRSDLLRVIGFLGSTVSANERAERLLKRFECRANTFAAPTEHNERPIGMAEAGELGRESSLADASLTDDQLKTRTKIVGRCPASLLDPTEFDGTTDEMHLVGTLGQRTRDLTLHQRCLGTTEVTPTTRWDNAMLQHCEFQLAQLWAWLDT